ncbi:MAG: ribose-phosphate diphosphokinase [Thermoproteota archaeon]|nr:ribose-phosphate diphosphokinase [Thermoproteota archaeon]
MMQLIVLSGAHHLLDNLKQIFPNVFTAEIKYFPDNELYLRFPFQIHEEVVIVQSIYKEPDKKLIELFFASHNAKDLGAKKIFAFIPYLAYTRQDRRYKEGEAISQIITLKMIRDSGISSVLTFDAHFHAGIPKIENLNIMNVKLAPYFCSFFKEFANNENFIAIGPDDDAYELATLLAKQLGLESGFIEKKRLGDSEVEVKKCSVDVKNKNIILVDDMISTGSTIIEAAKMLKNEGAKDIYVVATHGLFVANSWDKLRSLESIKKIICSNSIPNPAAYLDVSSIFRSYYEKWRNY